MKPFLLIFSISAFVVLFRVNDIKAQCNYIPTFTGNASIICENESITFSANNPNSGYTYQWYFDNVQDGTSTTKTKNFNTAGSIEVKLVADSLGICTDSTTINILVKNKPNPTFSISNDNMCSPVNGIFTNTTSGNNTYSWKEYGTEFSTNTNANKNYDIVGNGTSTFDIRLIATSNFGCMDSIQQVFTTKMRPDASIDDQQNQEKFKSCGSTISNPTYTFNLNNTSSTSATNTNYIIDWGDGSTSYNNPTLPNGTSHTYNTLGYLPLVLTVSDGNGCSSTDTYQLFNGTNPSLGFASVSGTIGLCSPTTLLFDIDTSKTNNNAPGTTYTMIFDDGSLDDVMVHPVLPEYYHTFTSSSCGHNTNNTNDSYSIKLKAENGCGVKNITIDPIQLGSTPTADFTSIESLCIGSSFTFNATTSGDVTITSSGTCYYDDGNYIWSVTPMTGVSFNNNNNSSVTIQFDSIGAFDVKMVIDNSSSTNGCGADSITKTIQIVAPPVASFIPSFHTNIIISGDSSILATTNTSNTIPAENSYGAIYNWSVSVLDTSSNCNFESNSWNFSSTDSTNDVEPSFVFHNAGFYEITLIATNACGSSAPYKDTIEITRKPIVSINDLSAICSGDSINASAVIDTCYGDIISYSWNFSGGTPNSANTLTPPAVSFTNNTNGNITQTISLTVETSGGSTTVNKNVIIKPLPQVPAISSTSPICDGDSLTLSVVNNTALSYQWQHPDGAISDTFAFTSYTPFADWYYITVSNGLTNCINTDSTLIEIDTLPIINIIATNQNPCVNTPIMLTASGATTYTWQLQGGNLTTNPLSLSPTQDSIYEVIGIDDNGCKNTTSIFIDTIALPIVNAGQNTVVCYQTPAIPVQLTGTQNTGSPNDGTWSSIGNIGANTISPNGIFTPNEVMSDIQLVYTYTNPNTGCENSDTMEIDVITPQIADAGNDITVCRNDAIIDLTMIGNSSDGVWRDASNAVITEFNPTTDGTFQLTYSIGAGSCISQDMMTITVHPLPIITLQNDFTICRYDTTVVLNNNTGTWTGIGIESGTANFLPMNVPTNSTTLNYSVTDINNCTNDDDLIITVNDVTTANAGTDQTFCNITTDIQLTGFSPTTNGTGTWSGNGMQNNSQGIFNSNGVSNTYEVYYTFVNNDNCEDTDTIEITVNDLVKPTLQNDTAVCINTNDLTFIETPTGGDWTVNGITTNNTFTPNQSGVYEFIYVIESGTTCESSDTLEIRVEDLPQLTLSNDFAACEDTTLIDLSENPFGGTWSGTGITDAANGIFDVSNGTQTLTYTYIESQVFYGNTLECSNNDNVTITVNTLPNVSVQDTIVYCLVNYDITLPTGSPLNGTWSGAGITAPNQFNPTNAGGIGDTTVTYTYIDGNSCENFDTMIIIVEASDSVSAGFNDTICITESSALLTDFYPTTGGTWSGNGVSSNGTFDPVQAGAGLHTLTFTYGNGTCQISVNKTRLVVDTTVINIGNDQTACLNEPAFQLTGFTPTGGFWTGTDVDSMGIFTPSSVNSFLLKYTYAEPINGCVSEDYKTIVINDLPISNAQTDTTLCDVNTTIVLPQGTANVSGNGIWTGSNSIISNTNLSVNPSLIGANNTDTLLYTFTDNFGCSVSDTMKITVIESDSINAGAKDTVCINAGAEVLVGYPAGGIWSGTGIILDSIFNNDNNNTPANTYTLTYTFDNGNGGCVVTATRERTVRALPGVDAGVDEIRCLNEPPFQLTGFSPVGGHWSGTNIDAAGIYTPTQTNSIALGYTYVDFFGCENFDAKTITINPLPTPNAQNDTILCDVNTTIQLPQGTPVLGGNGLWTGSNSIISNTNLSVNPSLIGANNTDTLLFTFTDNFGCSVTDSMEITVIESDSINAGANDTVCINAGAEVLVGYPAGGIWSGNGIIIDSIFNNDNNNTPAGIYTLTYTFDNGNGGCEVVDTRIRTVRALPIVDTGLDDLVCIENPAFTLSGFSPITDVFGTGIWTGNGITNDTLGIFESDTAGIGQHILTYTYTDFVGCIDSNTRVIDVVDLPIIDSLIGLDTLCNQPFGVQYVGYQNSGNPNDGVWSGQNMAADGTFTPNGVGDFTAYYCYTDNNTCERCDSILITVIPAEPIEAGIADTICIDEGIHTLTAEFPTGGFWSGSMAILDSIAGTFNPLIATGGWHTVTYTYGEGTCFVSDTTGVYVRDLAFVDAGADENACDTDADFAITGFSPTGGVWSGNGVTNNTGIFSPDAVTAGTYPITYFYTDSITGCDTSRVKNVFVHPLSQPDFTLDTILCINVPYTISDLSSNTTQWFWDFGDGTTYTTQNPTHTYAATGNYTIKLIAESVHGCKDSTTLTVFVTETPTASFTKDTIEGCTPLPVNFTNTSVGDSMSYSWNLGNSSPFITTLNPPTTIYEDGTQDTTYYITLTTSNLCGADIYTDSIIVFPKPQIIFAPTVNSGCTPLTVNFVNNTLGSADIFYWNYGDGHLDTFTNQNTHSHILYSDSAATAVHTITLIAENECGLDTATTSVAVHPVTVESFFNADTSIGCQPFTVNFTNYSTQGTTVIWNFGDGSTSDTIGSTNHTFLQSGTFKVVQYVTNGCGYDSTFTWITVLPSPTASFTSQNNICEDSPLTFTNTTANAIGQIWDFGDGNTSTDSIATHTYTDAGTYQVTLQVFNNGSQCPGFTIQTITILPKPIAVFSASDTTGCEDLAVQFTDASIGNITGYSYDFGDTNGSANASPTHTYLDSGVYTVKYAVVDANTCVSDTVSNDIVVYPIPNSDFAFAILDSCTIPTDVQFTNLSQGATGYQWIVDNSGNFITANNPTVTYPIDGVYNINLTAINIYGCRDSSQQSFELFAPPVAAWTVNQPNHCEPSTVTFTSNSTGNGITHYYDFGDSTWTSTASPIHIYNNVGTYIVKYYVKDVNGCSSDTLTQTIHVHPVPVSDFSFAILDSCASPAAVAFTNSSQGATNYLWYFGNGDSSYVFNPTEIYNQEGTYTVELIAENSFGCRDSILQTFELFSPPVAIWNVDQPNHCLPSTVTFTSNPIGNGITHYYDFGDSSGIITITPSPVHTYTTIGTYNTSYYVIDVNGCSSDTLTQTIHVHPVPVSDFAFAILDSCAIPAPVAFTNSSQGATNYLWRFGNGDSSYIFNPTEIYNQEGVYTVELVAENSFGCRDSIQQTFELFAPPVAIWNVDQSSDCLPSEVIFTNNSTGNGLNHFYNFDDGDTTTIPSPTHIYNMLGAYNPTYFVTDINGCSSDTLSEPIEVHPVPTSNFSFEILDSCKIPTLVRFTNLSQGATNYIWYLDNGEILGNVSPTTYYNQEGVYTIKLVAENSFGCRDSSQQTFEIYAPPTGFVTYEQLDTCQPSYVQFHSNALNTTDYYWNFGSGQTSNMAEPVATYQNVGIYDVELIIGVDNQCFDTLTYYDFVSVFPRPFANFTHLDTMINGRLIGVVRFMNNSIGGNQFSWNFGDNETSNLVHPLHTYQTNGLFDVELIATNNFNCSDDTIIQIRPGFFGTLVLPNIMTPEYGVGEDKFFIPKGIGLTSYLVEVFDKQGTRVFASTLLDENGTPVEQWDGTYQGKMLPQGAYIWKVKAEFVDSESTEHRTGTILIVR